LITHARRVAASSSVSTSRSVQLLLLSVAAAAALFSRTAVSPLQEIIRSALDLSDNQMALVQGAALALPMVVLAVPLGLLIDRRSRVRLLLIFSALATGASLLTALAGSFAVLFVARCFAGLAAVVIGTAAFSVLADLYAPEERGRASMVVVIGQYIGIATAFALGGALAGALNVGVGRWRWAMLWMTAPLVLTTAAAAALREPRRTGLAIENPSLAETCKELWRYRAQIVPLFTGLTLLQIAFQPALVWAAPALSRGFLLPPDRVGAIIAVGVMISGVIGSLAGGFLTDLCQVRGGSRRTLYMLCALALLSVPAALFPVVPSLVLVCALIALFLTLVSALEVSGTALFTIIIPNELRGLCIGALAAGVMIFGVGVGPLIVSVLSGLLGGPTMIGRALAIVAATAGILGAAAFWYGARLFPAPNEPTPTNDPPPSRSRGNYG
jgi:MFS family permease